MTPEKQTGFSAATTRKEPSTGLDGARSPAGERKEQFSGSLASEQNLRAQHLPDLPDEETDQRGK